MLRSFTSSVSSHLRPAATPTLPDVQEVRLYSHGHAFDSVEHTNAEAGDKRKRTTSFFIRQPESDLASVPLTVRRCFGISLVLKGKHTERAGLYHPATDAPGNWHQVQYLVEPMAVCQEAFIFPEDDANPNMIEGRIGQWMSRLQQACEAKMTRLKARRVRRLRCHSLKVTSSAACSRKAPLATRARRLQAARVARISCSRYMRYMCMGNPQTAESGLSLLPPPSPVPSLVNSDVAESDEGSMVRTPFAVEFSSADIAPHTSSGFGDDEFTDALALHSGFRLLCVGASATDVDDPMDGSYEGSGQYSAVDVLPMECDADVCGLPLEP